MKVTPESNTQFDYFLLSSQNGLLWCYITIHFQVSTALLCLKAPPNSMHVLEPIHPHGKLPEHNTLII